MTSLKDFLKQLYIPNWVKAGFMAAMGARDVDTGNRVKVDLIFSRAGSGSTTQQFGKVVEQAANVPAIQKLDGGCNRQAFRPSRTSLVLDPTGATNWSASGGAVITLNAATSPYGDNKAIHVTAGSVRITTQAISSANTYAAGIWVRNKNAGSFTTQFQIGDTNNTVTVTDVWTRVRSIGSPVGTNSFLDFDIPIGQEVYLWRPQLELGNYPTDTIGVDGATLSRTVEDATQTGLKAAGAIGASQGCLLIQIKAENIIRDDPDPGYILGATGSDYFRLHRTTAISMRPNILLDNAGGGLMNYSPTEDVLRLLLVWLPSGWHCTVNGILVDSGTEVLTFPTDTVKRNGRNGQFFIDYEGMSDLPLSSDDAADATGYASYEEMAATMEYVIL